MSKDDAGTLVPSSDSNSPDPITAPAEPAEAAGSGAGPSGDDTSGRNELLSGPVRLLLPIALAVGIILAMKYASGILNPILLALFLTMGATPALYWMRRKGLPPWLCVTIVTVVMVVAVLAFMLVMVSAVKQLDDKLPVYQANLQDMLANVTAWFSERGIDVSGLTAGHLSPESAISAIAGILSGVMGVIGSVFWLILLILFMVAQVYAFPEALVDDLAARPKVAQAFVKFSESIRTFLFTKGWLSALMAVIVTFIYLFFGTDFAVVWGLLFFVLSFVPNIGFVLSVIPPFFITLLEFGFGRAVLVVVIVIVLNTIIDNYVSPKIMGRSLGLSTLTVFISVFIWGWVLGGLGALMSVPLMLMVKILVFDRFESTKPISDLMGTPVRQLAKRRKSRGGGQGDKPAPAAE